MTGEGRKKMAESNSFRNEGHIQLSGGRRLAQEHGGRKTLKLGILTQYDEQLDETRLHPLRKDITNMFERLGKRPSYVRIRGADTTARSAILIPTFKQVLDKMKHYIAENPTLDLMRYLLYLLMCTTFGINHSDPKTQVQTAGHEDPNNTRWYPSVITFGARITLRRVPDAAVRIGGALATRLDRGPLFIQLPAAHGLSRHRTHGVPVPPPSSIRERNLMHPPFPPPKKIHKGGRLSQLVRALFSCVLGCILRALSGGTGAAHQVRCPRSGPQPVPGLP